MPKKLITLALAAALVLSLSACGDESSAQLKQEAAFAHSCRANGGYVYYDDISNAIHCDFTGSK